MLAAGAGYTGAPTITCELYDTRHWRALSAAEQACRECLRHHRPFVLGSAPHFIPPVLDAPSCVWGKVRGPMIARNRPARGFQLTCDVSRP